LGGPIADSPHYRTVFESFPLARLLSARAVVIGPDGGDCSPRRLGQCTFKR
jgi:hypothetical protein